MIQLKYDASTMKYFSVFEDVTGVTAKDCFPVDDTLVFFVEEGKAKSAVGKGGSNVKKLNSMLNKEIKIIEFSDNLKKLVKNALFPLKPKSVKISGRGDKKIVKVQFKSSRERRVLLDNNQKKLNRIKKIINRYYKEVEDIRILQL